jgi:hypothetical protein
MSNFSMHRPTIRSRIHYLLIMRKLQRVASKDELSHDLASHYALLVPCTRFEGTPPSWWVSGLESESKVQRAFEAWCELPAEVYDELARMFSLVVR